MGLNLLSTSDASARHLAQAASGDMAAAGTTLPTAAARVGLNNPAASTATGSWAQADAGARRTPRSFDGLMAQYRDLIRRCSQEEEQDSAQCKKVSSNPRRIREWLREWGGNGVGWDAGDSQVGPCSNTQSHTHFRPHRARVQHQQW